MLSSARCWAGCIPVRTCMSVNLRSHVCRRFNSTPRAVVEAFPAGAHAVVVALAALLLRAPAGASESAVAQVGYKGLLVRISLRAVSAVRCRAGAYREHWSARRKWC